MLAKTKTAKESMAARKNKQGFGYFDRLRELI